MDKAVDYFRKFFSVKFVREVSVLQLGQILSLLIGFAGSVVFARVLGPERYGIYAIITSLAGMISALINFGVWPTTMTLISEALGRNDREEFRNLVIYFVKLQLLLTNGLWFLVLILSPQLVSWFYHEPTLAVYLQITVLINAASIFFPLLTLSYQVFRRVNEMTIWETVKKFLATTLGIILVLANLGVIGVFYSLLAAEVLFLALSIFALFGLPKKHPIFPRPEEFFRNFWKVKLGRYLKFGAQIATDKNLNNFLELLPGFMLGILSTPEQAGLYKIALKVGALPKVFSGTISRMLSTILPFKESIATGSAKKYYHQVAKFGTLFTLGVVAAVALGSRLLFVYLFGPAYAPALPVVYVILLTNLLMGFAVSFGPIVRTFKKVGASIWLNFAGLILTGIIGWFAIPRFGAMGAAYAMFGWFIISLVLIVKIETWLTESRSDSAAPVPQNKI